MCKWYWFVRERGDIIMKQMIYTDCETGIENGTGFQFYSYSENIDAVYKEKQATICSYERVSSLSRQPDKTEIEEKCPIRYTYDVFDDNHAFMSRNSYLGLTHKQNRWGNMFSHALCFKPQNLNVYPIALYDSSVFLKDITNEQKNSKNRPDYLPEIDDSLVETKINLTEEDVARFINADGRRVEYLKQMIGATIIAMYIRNNVQVMKMGAERPDNRKTVIINDEKENIPYWIAAITYAFPLYLAKEISFSTYVYSPGNESQVILGASNNTAYVPNDPTYMTRCFIFDFKNDIFPRDIQTGVFTEYICNAYMGKLASLAYIREYMQQSEFMFSNGNIDQVLKCYQIYSNDKKSMNLQEMVQCLDYVNINCKLEFVKKFYSVVSQNLISSGQCDTYLLMAFFRKMIEFINLHNSEEMWDKMGELYWNRLSELLRDYVRVGEDKIDGFMQQTMGMTDSQLLLKSMFYPVNIEKILAVLERNYNLYPNKVIGTYLFGYINSMHIGIQQFARTVDNRLLGEISENLQGMPQAFDCIMTIWKSGISDDLIWDMYMNMISPIYKDKLQIFVNSIDLMISIYIEHNNYVKLKEILGISIIYSEEIAGRMRIIDFLIRRSKNPVKEMKVIYNLLIETNKQIWDEQNDSILQSCYSSIANDKRMIRQYCCEVIDLGMAKNYDSIIKQFDATVDITQTANEDIKDFKIFGEILENRNIGNISSMHWFAVYRILRYIWGKEKNGPENIAYLNPCNLNGFTSKEKAFTISEVVITYSEFLQNPKNHGNLFSALKVMENGPEMIALYVKELYVALKDGYPQIFLAGLEFLVENRLLVVRNQMVQQGIKTNILEKNKRAVESIIDNNESRICWERFLESVDEAKRQQRGNGLFSKLANSLFGGKNKK